MREYISSPNLPNGYKIPWLASTSLGDTVSFCSCIEEIYDEEFTIDEEIMQLLIEVMPRIARIMQYLHEYNRGRERDEDPPMGGVTLAPSSQEEEG